MNSKIRKPAINKKRSLSRLMAIQVLYQSEFLEDERELKEITEDIIENYALSFDEDISSYRKQIDRNFIDNVITGISLDSENINQEIKDLVKEGWSLETLDDVLIQILRCGCFELKFFKDIPLKVVIDEYVDIAASFFDDKKVTFANGILENLAKKLREDEYQQVKEQKNG